MAGQHDTDKHQISVKFHHRVWRQVEIAASLAVPGMTPGEFIRFVVGREVDSIPLTAKDAQIIADRIARAEEKGKMV